MPWNLAGNIRGPAGSGGSLPLTAYATADVTLTNQATPQPDPVLTVAAPVSGIWDLMIDLIFLGNTTDDAAMILAYPSDAVVTTLGLAPYPPANAALTGVSYGDHNLAAATPIGCVTGLAMHARIVGTYEAGVTAGSIVVNWAQNNASANQLVRKAGSRLTLTRVG